ncbi:ABC transporter ATP-binding protein [Corynebacterium pelargi]|uniref:Trehalose import ATP-binding protein SugC n=1 Tax=Corynebacterium pelargi TaxID=1471400 RepID=A0A410WAU3_9CORY|nr:sn-glycerol-3-phosphate ABC transporter ATP-binding protein UgpC [Corynebacterium pelargi]QAU53075.1 Trehalose import ATP-binding protein SugC [Corynebacterium pelargi]GGG75034.1 sugar ABC transporter ATP-binding protein [Corynebacterium pelargi]
MASVRFEQATRIYPGASTASVDHISLEIHDGEFLVLVGPSGCGKSTTLRMLAGLEEVNEGRIFIGDRDVSNVAPKDRDIAMVFQNYALYPHMSVRENMGFALKMDGRSKEEINQRVEEAARMLDLSELLDRKPKALSGGQRQRVAMGRAIVREPQVFLMDEPLSNLDAKLRVQTRTQIASLQKKLGVTTVYVTHDQTEALTMGDRIAVLESGVLQQVGTPRELYELPANAFVAGFIGSPAMNLHTFQVEGDQAVLGQARLQLSPATLHALEEEGSNAITLGFRPEALELLSAPAPGHLPLEITLVEELGSDTYLYGALQGAAGRHAEPSNNEAADLGNQVVIRTTPGTSPAVGSTVFARVVPGGLHCFSTSSGARLPQ